MLANIEFSWISGVASRCHPIHWLPKRFDYLENFTFILESTSTAHKQNLIVVVVIVVGCSWTVNLHLIATVTTKYQIESGSYSVGRQGFPSQPLQYISQVANRFHLPNRIGCLTPLSISTSDETTLSLFVWKSEKSILKCFPQKLVIVFTEPQVVQCSFDLSFPLLCEPVS